MNPEIKKYIKEKLTLVPEKPGSYQMRNSDNIIIYVGKAKNLKNRLKSYFTGAVTGKTQMLVNDITDFEYIVTNSELESLILEITLIKKYNPKYNILLKDDKSYPYIEITNDKYPSVKVVRNVNRKKRTNKLFGPYPNVFAARRTVEIINRMYPLRKCNNFNKEVCLYYHIEECLGYCKKDIDIEKVETMKKEIISFLKGDAKVLTNKMEKRMLKASNDLNFEKAKEYKEMINDINITLAKQNMDLNKKYNFDMFAHYKNNNYLSIQVFFIRDGLLFGRHSEIITILDDESEEMLEYIIKFYEKNNLLPKEIIVNDKIDSKLLEEYLNIKTTIPKKGDIKSLLNIATNNATIALNEKEETLKKNDVERLQALEDLKKILNTDKVSRIEAFDNSHLFGTFYVGAMVVFDDLLPNKNLYRKYKVNIDNIDDLSAMREVLYRRYYKMIMENLEKPDLIVVDGGKTQVNIAKEIISALNLDIKILGLKKDDKHKTNALINSDELEIELNSKSNLFLFLTKIQDEVHNFAISYHRNIKSKGMLSSLLDLVDGIGEIRKKQLLKKYGSLKKMSEASIEDLQTILNKEVAQNLHNYLKTIDNTSK